MSANQPQPSNGSPIAGSVLPLQRAEELIASLAGVVSARITATETGGVDAIHVLVTGETLPKQMVRNVESALMAHLGLRVDHRKISVAVTARRPSGETAAIVEPASGPSAGLRTVYFEDVEIRGSRVKGLTCRVTLRVGGEQFAGEAEATVQSDRGRMDVAAQAAVAALALSGGSPVASFSFEGAKLVDAFEREYVFVGVTARSGRDQVLLTGSAEVRESPETAAVLAVLDATNRWMASLATGQPLAVDRRGR